MERSKPHKGSARLRRLGRLALGLVLPVAMALSMGAIAPAATAATSTCTPDVSTIAQCFPDPNLANAVAQAAGHDAGQPLTRQDIASITSLADESSSISNLRGIENLTNLTQLILDGNQISDVGPLAKLTNLTYLDLGGNQVSDVGPLAKLTNLTYLWLDGNQISDISPLANLPDLIYLSLGDNQISDVGPLAKLANLTNLTYLILDGNQISDVGPLANLPDLTELWLGGNRVSDVGPLANLNLVVLDLDNNRVSDVGPLANLNGLNDLNLDNNQVSDISPLAKLTNPFGLHLGNNRISDVGPLAKLTNLDSLDLGQNQVSDISPLAKLTKLDSLRLDHNRISDISPLAKLTNLTDDKDGPGLTLDSQSVSLPAVASSSLSVSTGRNVDGSFIKPDKLTPSSGSYDEKTGKASWKGLSGSGNVTLHAGAPVTIGTASDQFDATITQPYTPPAAPVVKYSVSFDAQGGSAVASQSVAKGSKATKPADPTRSGYTFAGWSSDKMGSKPYDFSTAVNTNLTLYAQWKAAPKPTPTYTISFDANGGKFANGSASQKVSVKQGAKYALAAAPSRSGYTFAGWFTAKSGGSKVTGSPVATAARTLYAQWKAAPPVKLTTSFSAAGSSNVTANSATVSATLKDSAGKPVAGAGVVFATADGKVSASVKTSASGVAKASLTGLKASTKYSVTAKYAGDATHSASTLGSPIAFTTKAAPKPAPTYTVSFDANGGRFANGSSTQKVSVKQGAKYALAAAPSRPGYTFTGWFTAKSGGSKVTGTPVATGSLTVYAQWVAAKPAPKPSPKPALGATQPVYRVYNRHSGLHHYTTNLNEKNALVKLGWKDEGASFNAAKPGSANGLKPVYREYNPHNGNHNWTLNPSEHKQLVKLGWKDEGTAWYANPAGPVTVYRLYNPHSGEHVYTTSAKEYAVVGAAGWHQEGTAWQGL
jgi:uncharacterized repeat protein (TIGR02543 family)